MATLRLVRRNLLRRPLRSVLTVLSLVVAIYLICALRTLVTTLTAGVESADSRRLAVMSSTGLFVELPISYQQKIDAVKGVERTTKFQWFGGYYRSMRNFFAQFAVDADALIAMYPECKLTDEEKKSFLATKNGCVVGDAIAKDFGWKVGEHGPDHQLAAPTAREQGVGIRGVRHLPLDTPNFDNRTLFFHWTNSRRRSRAADPAGCRGLRGSRAAAGGHPAGHRRRRGPFRERAPARRLQRRRPSSSASSSRCSATCRSSSAGSAGAC